MQWIIPIKYIYVCYSKIGFIAFLIEQFRIRSYFIQLVLQHQTVARDFKACRGNLISFSRTRFVRNRYRFFSSKHFVGFQNVWNSISRYILKMLSRHVLKKSSTEQFLVFQDFFKMYSEDISWRCIQDVLKMYLQDEKLLRWRYLHDVLKTCFEDIFKTSWRSTNFSGVFGVLFFQVFFFMSYYFS